MIIFDKRQSTFFLFPFLLSHFVRSIVYKHQDTLVRYGFGDFGLTAEGIQGQLAAGCKTSNILYIMLVGGEDWFVYGAQFLNHFGKLVSFVYS